MKTPEEWMREFEGRIADAKAKAAAIQQGLANAAGSASSADGAVTVSVAPTGALTDLRLTPAALAKTPAALSAEIMAVARKAQRSAAHQVADAFAVAGGAGSETYRLITDYLPPEEEPAPEPARPEQARFVPQPLAEEAPPPPPARPRRPAPPPRDDDDGDFSDESIFRK
ncbi:YbaB/EbfC family nucleoid-associated protein [Actinokineospora sp. NPDC004072]